MPSGHDEDDERFARVWERHDAGARSTRTGRPARSGDTLPGVPRPLPGTVPADDPRDLPGDPSGETDARLARELEVAAALRRTGARVPGPDAAASARMRSALLAEITTPTSTRSPADGPRESTRVLRGAPGPAGSTRPSVPEPDPAGGRGAGRVGQVGTARTRSRRDERESGSRPGDGRPAGRAHGSRSATRRAGARMLNTAITGACAILLLGALTVLLSRGALPGEMLYSVKRASEGVELGLTSGQEAKGLKHLDFAAIRLEEVSDLVARQGTSAAGSGPVAAGLDAEDAALVLNNLRAFDEQARTGSRMILPLTSAPGGPSPGELSAWARSQSGRLDTLSPSLDPGARAAAADSQLMLKRLGERADAIGGPESCTTGGSSDDLGPLPAESCTSPAEQQATAPPSSSTSSSSTTRSTTSTTTTTSTTSPESSSSDEDQSSPRRSTTDEDRTSTPAPVQVPVPVPLLPQVDLPPLVPGLPGISLGG